MMMESALPMLPLLAIVMVAVFTFLYTVSAAVESKTELIELKIEVHRMRDDYAKRRGAMDSGGSPDPSGEEEVIDCEVEVLDAGLGENGPANRAA